MFDRKEYNEQYYIKNRTEILKYKKQHYLENGEINKETKRKNDKRYRKNNAEKIKKYKKEYCYTKRKTDSRFNLNDKMGRAIRESLKKNKQGWHWEILVGYSLDELIKHLEKTIPKGYTWQDFLEGRLHIDHKIPISVFNYTKPEHADFKRCWALKNLQSLPAEENWRKSNKLKMPFQPALKMI